MLVLNRAAMLSYKEDEIAYIQQIYISDKQKLSAQKIVDRRRVINTIDNLKDILLSFYQQKLPVEIRYALFLCIDHIRTYLVLITEPDWPVDRDIAQEIQVLAEFKKHFYSYLLQMNNYLTTAVATLTVFTKRTPKTDAAMMVLDLPKLLKAALNGLDTPPLTTVADIARLIQFISYICNDFNDLKGELDQIIAPLTAAAAAAAAATTATVATAATTAGTATLATTLL